MMKKIMIFLLVLLVSPIWATANEMAFMVHNLWILIAAGMVFLMHLGFASLEAGLTRSKNTVNILFKNVGVLSIGILSYAWVGFNLMYPGDAFSGGFFGFAGFGLHPGVDGMTPAYDPSYTYWTDFIFQAMFAATAATIVSGAVAERMKLSSFLLFTTFLVGLAYPIIGMWKWGGGFLDTLATPFYDFAGSTIVHSVGGWAALVAVLMLGPRLGKYVEGRSVYIKPHSFALVSIGVFLLWFGWYGFNGGSVLSADPATVSLVFVITTLGASSGALSAMLLSWIIRKRPDLAMTLNGCLGGLVGITAAADQLSPFEAVIVGGIAGLLVVTFVMILEKQGLDDPVGAISVHLVGGVWGTLAVGLFGGLASLSQLKSQVIGILAVGVTMVLFSVVTLSIIKRLKGIRVDEDHERIGLDMAEHQEVSYWIDQTE